MNPIEISHLHRTIDDCKDSIEIGTPGKGGAIKVYGDAADPEKFMRKIQNAFELRRQAQLLLKESDA
ncbi:MAG: hypothetical protein WC138_13695 [Methanoculleus sp.]